MAIQGFTARPASELQIGDMTVWNYGSTAEVMSIRTAGKSVYVTLRAAGKVHPERRFMSSSLVPIACPGLGGGFSV